MTVLTDLMLSSMARKNRQVLKFIHKVMVKNIKQYLNEMENFRKQLHTEVKINQKLIDKWSGFQAEPADQQPLFCDDCTTELYLHYFYSYKFKKRVDGQACTWFCQACTIKGLKKDKALFPKELVGFRRYNEERLNSMIQTTGLKFSSMRSASHE